MNLEQWPDSLTHAFRIWCLWIIFFPMIVWLSLRFPLERTKIFSQTVIHLSACLLVVVVSQVVYRNFIPQIPPPTGTMPTEQAHLRPLPSDMRVVPDILVYLVTMGFCVAFAHFQKAQERERRAIELEASLARAKLQALRMQINPHFLFNTLNAIATFVHTAPQTADDMITDLSELFRASLESQDEHEISLARELELLQRYLAIEQLRFGPRLKVEQLIDPEILPARVPTLILQPLVENAIRHGIEPQTGGGTITIQAARAGNQIKLLICDTGKKPSPAAATAGNRQGIGLANTRARLQQLYGAEQSFTAGTAESGGWRVEISLPFYPAPTRPAAA